MHESCRLATAALYSVYIPGCKKFSFEKGKGHSSDACNCAIDLVPPVFLNLIINSMN